MLDVSEEQSRKTQLPMLVRLAGSLIDVNEEQPLKAQSPRIVRLAGSSIDVNDVQPSKVPCSRLSARRRAQSSRSIARRALAALLLR